MKFHWQRSDQTLKIPLRFVLIAPFVLLTIGAVGLVGYLSWHNGQQAVNDLANQLMDEVGDRVTLKLDTYLETPYVVNELNIDAIELGQINPNHLPQIERHFWRQIWRFDSVISIAVGTEDGEFTAIGRPGKDVAPVLKISTSGRETNGYLQVYNTDNQGNRSGTPEINRPYDPRERPWYVDTMRAGEPIWSEIYPDFTDPRLVITASQPLYDEVNQLKGVLSVDLLLSTIGEFLQTIEIGKQGQIFIIEQSGLLVANSTSEKPFVVVDEEVQRIQATESKNPLIRFTTAQLQKKYGDFTQIRMSQQGRFQLNQNELNQWQEWAKEQIPQSARQSFTKDFFLQVTPLRDERGLDWLIVIVVPEADFMGQIYANTRTTLVLSAGALLGAIAFGLLTAQWINRPIQRLSRASRALAEGEWHQALKEDSPIAELQVLAHAFNQTAEQLQQAFDRVKIALQASEEKFTKVFRVSPDPIGIATPEGRYLEVNDAFLNLFGYSREEVIGRKTAEIGLWVNLQERQHYVKLAQADGRVRNLECTMRQKSGRLLTILFSAESIELQGQLCLIGIAKEITDRKQLELALQRSEAKLNHVLNSAIAAVTSIRVFPDGNWQYEYRSEGCEAVFGYTAQELMADPALWQSRVFPDDAAQVLELNVKNFMTEGTFTEEYRFYHKDDSLRWISGHLTSRWDEATASWLITAVDIDITDRVCAEEALRQSEATKNQILKAIPDLIVWMTADGTCIDLIEGNSINTVISRVDAIGKNLFDLLPIELAHQRMNAIQHALRTGDVQIYEQQITNNEKTRYEEVRIVAITADQVLTIIRDITDRKQAEAALEAQRAFFYQVIDVIPSPVFVKDSEGRFIVANQAIVAVHGTSVKEVLGKREIDFNPHFDPAQIERYLANNREVMMTRQSKQNPPHQVPTATGQLRWFQTLLSPLIDANGHVQGIVGNSVDITDLKQVEEALQQQNQALRESEERFRSAFQDARSVWH